MLVNIYNINILMRYKIFISIKYENKAKANPKSINLCMLYICKKTIK